MASKGSLYGGGDRERDRRTRQWRTARIERFTEIQRREREWINFAEIAEYCSEESGVVPNEVARVAAYKKLLADLREGYFEENGRSQVLYLHPYTTKARMTRKWLAEVMEIYGDQAIISQYLAHCWIPRRFLERWLAKHRMQPRPERFEPKWPTPPATQANLSRRPAKPSRHQWDTARATLRRKGLSVPSPANFGATRLPTARCLLSLSGSWLMRKSHGRPLRSISRKLARSRASVPLKVARRDWLQCTSVSGPAGLKAGTAEDSLPASEAQEAPALRWLRRAN
jgi:hypothetical protein